MPFRLTRRDDLEAVGSTSVLAPDCRPRPAPGSNERGQSFEKNQTDDANQWNGPELGSL